ncbi:MAG: hypothetical protein AAGE96_05545 [Cyanobacteria bacterium P01_G01_bin.19]
MKTTSSTKIEWVNIAPKKIIVATPEEVNLHIPSDNSDRFLEPMVGVGSVATTRNLLDGAMAAAKIAVNSDVVPPEMTPNRFVWQLAGAYQITHVVPPLMKQASERFASLNRHILSSWAFEKSQEEKGHDRLALLDLQSLGYRAEELVSSIVPRAATSLVDYFTRSVNDSDPIDCVGFTYAIERISLGTKEEHIQNIESLLPQGINATRCIRVHSAVGADAGHVDENVEMIAGLSAAERIRVVRACYETALLIFSPPQEGYHSEAELENMFEPYKL